MAARLKHTMLLFLRLMMIVYLVWVLRFGDDTIVAVVITILHLLYCLEIICIDHALGHQSFSLFRTQVWA